MRRGRKRPPEAPDVRAVEKAIRDLLRGAGVEIVTAIRERGAAHAAMFGARGANDELIPRTARALLGQLGRILDEATVLLHLLLDLRLRRGVGPALGFER